MKLISVQSRGDRLVRIAYGKPHYFVYLKALVNDKQAGFCINLIHSPDFYKKSEALRAAEEWLKGAKV